MLPVVGRAISWVGLESTRSVRFWSRGAGIAGSTLGPVAGNGVGCILAPASAAGRREEVTSSGGGLGTDGGMGMAGGGGVRFGQRIESATFQRVLAKSLGQAANFEVQLTTTTQQQHNFAFYAASACAWELVLGEAISLKCNLVIVLVLGSCGMLAL